MYAKDNNNNDEGAIALYESYLSKYIVEYPLGYDPLFKKITEALLNAINQKINTPNFDRKLFAIFSLVNEEFPGFDNIECFLKQDLNLFATACFHKLIFELLTTYTYQSQPKLFFPSLATLTHAVIANDSTLLSKLRIRLDEQIIFNDHKSSRKIKKITPHYLTNKLGIATEKNTPSELINYFPHSYIPGQNKFDCNPKSKASQWLRKNKKPFVAGISGTIATCYCGIIQLGGFSNTEIKSYLMVISACLVARGHHSFSEMHPVIKSLGYDIQEIDNIKDYMNNF